MNMNQISGEAYIRQSEKGMGYFLEVDYDAALAFLKNNSSRILLDFDAGEKYHRALQKRKDGYAMITLSKQLLKDIKAEPGQKVKFNIVPDKSKYGMAFPEEFEELLAQDLEAKTAFEKLTPGRQRGVLHYVASGKSIDTRIKRSIEIAEKAKTERLYGQRNA